MKKLLLILPLALTLGSCSIYARCLKPEIGKITWTGTAQELGEVVESMLLCDPTFSAADVPPCAIQALDDFANALGPDGKNVENCVLLVLEGNGSAQVQARAKAMGVKRGIHAAKLECHATYALRSPGDSTPKTGPTAEQISENTGHGAGQGGDQLPHAHALAPERDGVQRVNHPAISYSYPGETPGHALTTCDVACGQKLDGLPTDHGCLCWRADRKNWRNSRWVALREGAGLGIVAAR